MTENMDAAHRRAYDFKNLCDEAARALYALSMSPSVQARLETETLIDMEAVEVRLRRESAHIVAVWD